MVGSVTLQSSSLLWFALTKAHMFIEARSEEQLCCFWRPAGPEYLGLLGLLHVKPVADPFNPGDSLEKLLDGVCNLRLLLAPLLLCNFSQASLFFVLLLLDILEIPNVSCLATTILLHLTNFHLPLFDLSVELIGEQDTLLFGLHSHRAHILDFLLEIVIELLRSFIADIAKLLLDSLGFLCLALLLLVDPALEHLGAHVAQLLFFLVLDHLLELFVLTIQLAPKLLDLEVSHLLLGHLDPVLQVLLLQQQNVLLAFLHLSFEFLFSFLHVLVHLELQLIESLLVVSNQLESCFLEVLLALFLQVS